MITHLPPEEPPPGDDVLAAEGPTQEQLREHLAEVQAAGLVLANLQTALVEFISMLDAAGAGSAPCGPPVPPIACQPPDGERATAT